MHSKTNSNNTDDSFDLHKMCSKSLACIVLYTSAELKQSILLKFALILAKQESVVGLIEVSAI